MSNSNDNYMQSSNSRPTHEYPYNMKMEEIDSALANHLHLSNECNFGNSSQTAKVSPLHGQQNQSPSLIQVPPPPGFNRVPKFEQESVPKGLKTQNVEQQYIGDSSRMGTSLPMLTQSMHPSNGASSRMELTPEFVSKFISEKRSKDPSWWRKKNDAMATAVFDYIFEKAIAQENEQIVREKKSKASDLEKK